MRKKLKQYEIFKISTGRLTETQNRKIKIIPLVINKRAALEHGELVKIQANQLTNAIHDYLGEKDVDMSEIIINVVVPQESKKAGEREYKELATKGFTLNDKRYVRLFSGSGQIRRNTVTFIREDLYKPILDKLLCGLSFEDFGDSFNAAKFNAYAGLNMSGCHLLPFELSPRVCVVDDYEAIRPHDTVNMVTEKQVEYITLPECDYILKENDTDFIIEDGKAIRKSDNVGFTVRKGIHKTVQAIPYDEIESSPELNSFDGQGLMSPSWAQKVATYLGYDYIPSEMIVRAPWVKGLLACVPFFEYFADRGITEITDSFGKVRSVTDIDVIISKSQFKMWKVYKAKCEPIGINAWDYHQEAMRENNLRWGIVKPNAKQNDTEKALNYQYLQALRLDNEDVDALCARTEEFLTQLNNGNIEEVYNSLVVNNKGFTDMPSDGDYKKLFQKVIECNPNFINDKYIRSLILKECQSKLNGAKLGKLLVRGNFQFCVSDPIAQLQWIEKKHCNSDVEVMGVIPAGYVYSNYWLNAEDYTNEIVLMRSPLIDRNEIAKRKLVTAQEHLLRYLQSGIIYSVHDLTALQQGGCDYDGDIIFSTNNSIIAKGCYEYGIAKPLYYELGSTDLVGCVTKENIIEADIRGLNSAVGTISNKGGSLYAMLQKYEEGSSAYNQIYNSIVQLGQIVGQEIDRIKTAVSPAFPLEWGALQPKSIQKRDFSNDTVESQEELQGIYRHNEFVPDIKPYYFRYNYNYIDDSIRQLDRAFNKVSIFTYGLKLSELLAECKKGENVTDEMMFLYKQYKKSYPVIDTDCTVNHVCKHFEQFEKSMKKQVRTDGVNMLGDFNSSVTLDDDIMKTVKNFLAGYQRFKRILTRNNNSNFQDGTRKIKETTSNALDMMCSWYKEEIIKAAGNLQVAYDYMVAATGNEATIWEILDEDILQIIKRGANNDYIR